MNKKIKAVLFDLDGTLLPMNEDEFTKGYFSLLCKKLIPLGYNKDELIKTIWTGTKEMAKNNGIKTNEEVFWKAFANVYGKEKLKDKQVFDEFYLTDFKKAQTFCKENKFAKQLVNAAKDKGLKTILSSNPVFPRNGMVTRLGFVGLNENDFDYITSYENAHFSKPNPKYFQEILDINNLKSDEVILFGNSEVEDIIPARSCGIQGYLVGDCVSLQNEKSENKILTYDDALSLIKQLD